MKNKVFELRNEGYTLGQIAYKIGRTRQRVSQILQGERYLAYVRGKQRLYYTR